MQEKNYMEKMDEKTAAVSFKVSEENKTLTILFTSFCRNNKSLFIMSLASL